MKRYLAVLTVALFVAAALAGPAGAQTLKAGKNMYKPGETITVHFTAPAGYAKNAWVGIVPSNVPHGREAVNDQHDLAYQYLEGRTSGDLVFTAPMKTDFYDFRMHDTDNNGKETASTPFAVMTDAVSGAVSGGPSLSLAKSSFAPGEAISVNFTAAADFPRNAWVGVIPAGVPHGDESVNDQHDLTYQYLEKRTGGVLTFNAPTKPGAYDFRMHDTDNNGKEVASVSFTVK
jgi:hypothetical protein